MRTRVFLSKTCGMVTKRTKKKGGSAWGARNAKKVHEAVRGGAVNSFGRKNKIRTVRGAKARKKKNNVLTPEDCIKKIDERQLGAVTIEHTFADFSLDQRVVDAVRARGFDAPTPIQDKAIPPIMQGRDVIGLAQTGTGKTAAFLLPLISRLLTKDLRAPVLIITPTRELAVQIAQDVEDFTAQTDLTHVVIIGGANARVQERTLREKPQIIIGTPGRLHDLLEQGVLTLSAVRAVVIDEIDRMVDMGFVRELKYLMEHVNPQRQTLVFSATLKKQLRQTVRAFLTNPVTVAITPRPSAMTVAQDIVWVRYGEDKVELLHDVLIAPGVARTIIFVNTKIDALALTAELKDRGFSVVALQGDLSQGARKRIITQFKEGKYAILVATDIAARGIDVPDVTHVINFDPPQTHDDYVHRIGRTGRSGKRGTALTFWEKV